VSVERILHLATSVQRAMVAHATREVPIECCGFLIGRDNDVFCAVEMDNVDRSPVRYRIDDAAHLELRRVLRGAAPPLAILGVYHSHPQGDAYPSETDVAEAHYPGWVHVIVGLGGRLPVLRAFEIVGATVRSVTLR